MIAFALILLLLALLLTVAIVTGGGDSITVDLFGSDVSTSVAVLYITGLLVGVATLLALVLLRIGLKKGWRQRKRMKDLQHRAERAEEHERQASTDDSSAPAHEAVDNDS